jgi:hypothetical protein
MRTGDQKMRKRTLKWFQKTYQGRTQSKVRVLEEIAAYLIANGREELVGRLAHTGGDGLTVHEDRFTFCGLGPTGQRPLSWPLHAVVPIYSCYVCEFKDIHSVYEDEEGRPVIILRCPDANGDGTPTNGHVNG